MLRTERTRFSVCASAATLGAIPAARREPGQSERAEPGYGCSAEGLGVAAPNQPCNFSDVPMPDRFVHGAAW